MIIIAYAVHLCEGCIEDLKDYNPYIDKDLVITKVSIDECDNKFLETHSTDEYNKRMGERNSSHEPVPQATSIQ